VEPCKAEDFSYLCPPPSLLNRLFLEPSFLDTFMSWDFTRMPAFIGPCTTAFKESGDNIPPWSYICPMGGACSHFQEDSAMETPPARAWDLKRFTIPCRACQPKRSSTSLRTLRALRPPVDLISSCREKAISYVLRPSQPD